jgi:STE24 endopeptidase
MNELSHSNVLIFLFAVVYSTDALSRFLNIRSSRLPLPAQMSDLQTPIDQKRASEYLSEKTVLNTLKDFFFLILFAILLKNGFFEALRVTAIEFTSSTLGQSLIFVGALALGQAILALPFSVWSTFKIEAHYGFNRTSIQTFFGDLIKAAVVGAILGGLLFSFVVWMLQIYETKAWIAIWAGYTAFQFFIIWLAPVTILPLFLKLSPLSEGTLKDAIDAYSKKQSFKLDGAWVCDASKRSAKSNAFFTGFGKFRRLVLFDTLIAKHTEAEIVAIVAHEAGHFKLGHIWKLSIFSAISTLVFFALVQYLVSTQSLYNAFGTQASNTGIGLVLAFIVLNKILFFFSPIGSYFSRKNEYAADQFSIATTGDPQSLASGLKRLVNENLATLQHHPLYIFLHDSHPPLPDRLRPILPQIEAKKI